MNDFPEYELPLSGVFVDIADAVLVPPQWVVENMIPVGLTLISAPPKAGKSTVIMALAAQVAGLGCKALPLWARNAPHTGPVIVLSAEARAGELKAMVEGGLGVKTEPNESILIAEDPWQFQLDDPQSMRQLMSYLYDRKPRLLVVDPLADFHQQDENASREIISIVRPLRQWAVDSNSSVIIAHHTRKIADGQTRYSTQDMRGSGALFGKADGILVFTPGKTSNCPHVAATFKRAKGWDRQIQVAAYEDVDKEAGEPLDIQDKLVLEGWQTTQDFQGIVNLFPGKLSNKDKVRESVAKLKRNGVIK